jgi:adenylate cyclase
VLPFTNQNGDPADDYFSDGITGDMINALGRFSTLRVMAYTAVLPYKNKGTAAEVGPTLGVRYLVDGSVQRAADRVRVCGFSNCSDQSRMPCSASVSRVD